MRIKRNEVLVARKHLAKAAEIHLPGSEVTDQVFLERRAEPRHLRPAIPARTIRATLEAVAAQEMGVLGFDISKTRDVDRVGTIAYFSLVHRKWQGAGRTAVHDVVHQVVPQLAARAAEATREFVRPGVEKDASRFHRRR